MPRGGSSASTRIREPRAVEGRLRYLAPLVGLCELRRMKLTAVFEPAREGGYICFVEEIPAAISQGETLDEAKANLRDALKLAVECQRELAEKNLSPLALREILDLAEA